MNKYYKNITAVFLLIINLIIITHASIPHDHHYDIASDVEHHHDDNSNGTPFHCHFFNNIDFDEVRTNDLTTIIKKITVVYTVSLSNLFNLDLHYQVKDIINQTDNLPDYCVLLTNSPTRGSPLV